MEDINLIQIIDKIKLTTTDFSEEGEKTENTSDGGVYQLRLLVTSFL